MARPQGGGTPKGGNVVQNEGVKRAQASLMLAKRIQGASVGDIAREFNTSERSVLRRIDYAQRHNLLADATDRVLNELVGKAHSAYANALESGDAQLALNAARDVMFGTGILSRNNKAQVAPATETVEMTLAVWREKRKQGYVAADGSGGDEAGADGEHAVIDAETVGEELGEADDRPSLPGPQRPRSAFRSGKELFEAPEEDDE